MPCSGGTVKGISQEMLENRDAASRRMGSLGNLSELKRVSQQDHRIRRGRDRQSRGECHLAGFIDHEEIDLQWIVLGAEAPGRPANQAHPGIGQIQSLPPGMSADFESKIRVSSSGDT